MSLSAGGGWELRHLRAYSILPCWGFEGFQGLSFPGAADVSLGEVRSQVVSSLLHCMVRISSELHPGILCTPCCVSRLSAPVNWLLLMREMLQAGWLERSSCLLLFEGWD